MTRYLIDTHAMIWWWVDSPKLSRPAREAIMAGGDILVSSASVWEAATLSRLGRLDEIPLFAREYGPLMLRDGFTSLPVDQDHAMAAGALPGRHRDPFDRMIAAQGLAEDVVVLTRDKAFPAFGCKVLW